MDKKKAKHFYELAAMDGDVIARHNLGCVESNEHRALKHFILAARGGFSDSMDEVENGFLAEYIAKDEYEKTLRAHQKIQDEMKSDDRDKARASMNDD